MARLFKPELKGNPINFLSGVNKVNLRSSPAVADKNLIASVPRWFASLGKLGEATGTIETVKGKNHFWIRIEVSTEVKLWYAASFNFAGPKYAWVRSDVVHWKGAKGIVKRSAEKVVEPVREVLDTTAEAAGTVLSTFLSQLWPYAAAAAGLYYVTRPQSQKRYVKK
jgi:hypothetical protein